MPLPRPVTYSELTARAKPMVASGFQDWIVTGEYNDKPSGRLMLLPEKKFIVFHPTSYGVALRTDSPVGNLDEAAKYDTIEEALTRLAQSLDPYDEVSDDDGIFYCRRPYCAAGSLTAKARRLHEASNEAHPKKVQMSYICTDRCHPYAIEEAGICPVCQ